MTDIALNFDNEAASVRRLGRALTELKTAAELADTASLTKLKGAIAALGLSSKEQLQQIAAGTASILDKLKAEVKSNQVGQIFNPTAVKYNLDAVNQLVMTSAQRMTTGLAAENVKRAEVEAIVAKEGAAKVLAAEESKRDGIIREMVKARAAKQAINADELRELEGHYAKTKALNVLDANARFQAMNAEAQKLRVARVEQLLALGAKPTAVVSKFGSDPVLLALKASEMEKTAVVEAAAQKQLVLQEKLVAAANARLIAQNTKLYEAFALSDSAGNATRLERMSQAYAASARLMEQGGANELRIKKLYGEAITVEDLRQTAGRLAQKAGGMRGNLAEAELKAAQDREIALNLKHAIRMVEVTEEANRLVKSAKLEGLFRLYQEVETAMATSGAAQIAAEVAMKEKYGTAVVEMIKLNSSKEIRAIIEAREGAAVASKAGVASLSILGVSPTGHLTDTATTRNIGIAPAVPTNPTNPIHPKAIADTSALNTATVSLTGSHKAMNDGLRGLVQSLGMYSSTMSAIIPMMAGMAIGAGLKHMLDQGRDLEYQMTFIAKLTEGVTISVEQFSKAMEGSQLTTKEGALGLRALAQAGLSAEDALTALPNVMNLAVVGEMQLGAAALVATGIMHAFNLQMTDMGHIIDVMTKAAAISNTSVEGMATAIKTASVVSDQFGVSLEEISAGLVVMAKRNIDGTSAGTAMKNFITNLASTTPIASARMKQLGIDVYDAEGNMKTMAKIIPELATAFVGLNEKSKNEALKDLFNERGRRAAAALIDDLALYGNTLDTLTSKSDDFAASVVRALDHTITGQMRGIANAFSLNMDKAFSETGDAWSNLLARFDEGAKSSGLREFAVGLSNTVVAIVDNAGKITAIGVGVAAAALVWQTYTAASAAATAAAVAVNPALAVTALTLEAQAAAAAKAATATGVLGTVLGRIFWPVAIVTGLYIAYQKLSGSIDEVAEAAERRNRESEDTIAKLGQESERVREETAAIVLQIREHINLAAAVKKVKAAKGELASQDRQTAITEAEKNLARIQAEPQPGGTDTWAWLARAKKAQEDLANLRKEQAAFQANESKQAPLREALNVDNAAKQMVETVKKIDDALALKSKSLQDYIDKVGTTNPALVAKLNAARESLSSFGFEINRLSKDAGSSRLAETTSKLAGSVAVLGQNAKNAIASADKLLETKDKVKPDLGGQGRSPHVERVKLETTNILEEQSKRDKLVLDAEKNAATNRKSVLDAELVANLITKSRYAAEVQYMEEQFAASSIAEINKQQEARVAAYIEAEGKVFAAQEEFNRRNKSNPVAISDNDRAIAKARADSANTYVTAYLTSEAQIRALKVKANTETEVAAAKHKGELKKVDKDFSDWEVSELALKEKNLRAIRNAAALRNATPLQAAVLTAEAAEFERLTANAEKYDVQIRELTDSKTKYEESLKLITVRSEKDEAIAKIEEETNKKVLEQLAALVAMKNKLTGGIKLAVDLKGVEGADEFVRVEVARIRNGLTEAILNSGKDSGKGLREYLEAELLTKPFKMVIQAFLQPVMTSIAQSMVGSAVGAGGGLGSLVGAAGSLGGFFSTGAAAAMNGAAGAALEGGAARLTEATSMAGAAQGLSQMAGSLAPFAAAAVVAAGMIERAQGSVSAAGTFVYGQNSAKGFQTGGRADFIQEGGGGTTKNSSWFDPGEATSKYMSATADRVTKSVKDWAAAIGLSADAVNGYTATIEAAIGGGMSKAEERQSIDKAMAGYGDTMVQSLYSQIMGFAKANEAPSATLERLGNDVTAVNNILRGNAHSLYDASFDSAKAVQELLNSVGGLDKFTALSTTLETVNTVLTKLGQSTFDISIDGAKAADALAKSVGGTDKLSMMADELIHVNENLAKLGKPLLDVSVASAQTAHNMLAATDSAVKAMEAAERLQTQYDSFTNNLSSGSDTSSVASLQAIFDKALSAVKVAIPAVSGLSDVTYDQYASYTDPQRTKLDAAASAFKNLQGAIDSAAKTAQEAAKTAQDAAESAAKAYEEALKSVEDSTRDVNRQLRDFGKTDFQKKLSQIAYAGQDKQSELDKLSAKATELSATANALSIKASNLSLDSVATISNDLISASIDLSDSSKEVAGNIKDTLANSTAALGDALTLVPAISSLFDGILAGLLKIPPALILVKGAVTGVGDAAALASGGLLTFGNAAGFVGSESGRAASSVNTVGAAFAAVAPAATAAGAALNALGAAFTAASAALGSLTGTFNAASSALDGINAAFASAATGLVSLGSAFESAGAAGASLAGSLGAVDGAFSGISGAAADAAGSLSAAVGALSAVAGAASSIQAPTGAAATSAVIVAAADGGYIRGAGTTTSDSIPAMLSDQEFVVRASSVKKYGVGFLDALNAGVLPKTVYREGGNPPSGAVGTLNEAQKQVVYLDTFSTYLTLFGGVLESYTASGEALAKAVVKLPETYTQALGTLKAVTNTAGTPVGKDFTGMDAASVSKFFRDLLANNAPTWNAETKTFELSSEAQAALAPFANAGSSIEALLKGLDEMKPWQDKLDVLMGTTTDRDLALQKDLASTTDTATQALIRQVYAQEDLNKAREEEAKPLDSVKDALKNLTKESSSLGADLNSAFGTSGGDSAAKTIRKDLALEDVRKAATDAEALKLSPTYAAMSAADKLKTDANIQAIKNTATSAERQYDLNEARKAEITLLGDAKSRLKSYTDASASKEVEKMRLQGNDAGANAAQKAIDLADVYKSTADATTLLAAATDALDIAALETTIAINKATEAQYEKNAADDVAIEILNRYKSVQEDAASTNIELLRAQGDTAGAAAIELANATKGFNDAQVATYRQSQANKGLIASLGNLASTTDMVTNSRIGLLTAKGDTSGAADLQRTLDIAPYVKSIADATKQLGIATTQTERDALNLAIATDNQSISNIDLSKSLDKEAQAANDAKSAADALANSYADLKKQIEQANIELLRASGDTQAADEAAMALALRDHAGDAYYETLYRELLTIQKLTAARQQLNGLEDTAVQSQIKLIRAQGGGVLANAMERSAFLKNATLPAAAAKAELDRSNVSWSDFLSTKGVAMGTANAGGAAEMAANLASGTMNASAFQSLTALDASGAGGSNLPEDIRKLLYEFGQNQRTASQKTTLQSVVDTAQGIAAAYDLNKSLEGQLKIIELQDEAYKANLDAQQKVTDAQKAYADVLRSTISTMQDFLKTLGGAATPGQSLTQARIDFRAVADKAASGDTSAYKDLTPAARAFLDLSKNYSKTIVDYRRDEAAVRNTLNAVINANQRELDKLPKEIAKAADPTKEAWIKLQEATAKETDTSIMLTALSVDKAASSKRLRTAEESLSDRYLEAVYMLEEEKKTPLLKAFNDAIAAKANSAALPEYTAFNLGDIWGTKIAGVLPLNRLTNEDLNRLIAEKFPGLLKSDLVVPITPDVLTGLIRGVMPTQLTAANLISSTADVSGLVGTQIGTVLTAASLVSTTADVSDIVNTQISTILPTNFAGSSFNAASMMQTAIDAVAATLHGTAAGTGAGVVTTPPSVATSPVTASTIAGTGTVQSASTWYEGIFDRYGSGQARTGTMQEYLQKAHSSGNGGWLWSSAAYAASIGKTTSDLIDAMHSVGLSGWGDMTVAELQNKHLKTVGIPAFAQGTNLVPQDMIAQLHKDEAVIPAAFNPAKYGRDSGNTALVEKIQELTAKVEVLTQKLEAGQNAIAANTGSTARTLKKFDIDGVELRT